VVKPYSSYTWQADLSETGNQYLLSNENSYWIAIVGFDGEVHRLAVDPLEIQPWSESAFGSDSDGLDDSGASWINQLIDGDMNMIIALVSAIMILLGGVLILKPKGRSAPQPWEMGTLEVEMEEQMYDEGFGIDDDFSDDDFIPDNVEDVQFDEQINIDPSPPKPIDNEIVDELLVVDEDIDLDDLSDLADDFDLDDLDDMAEELSESEEDIDTSFIDDIL
jgi:hypothetical protein